MSLVKLAWAGLGIVSVVLGIIGIALPLLPTTPFLLLAAFAFSKSSERLHDWLIEHAHLGPPIQAWREYRAVPRNAKWGATAALAAVIVISVVVQVPTAVLVAQSVVAVGVGIFLWTRPLPPTED